MEYEQNKSTRHYPRFILLNPLIWLISKIMILIKSICYSIKNRKKHEKYRGQKI